MNVWVEWHWGRFLQKGAPEITVRRRYLVFVLFDAFLRTASIMFVRGRSSALHEGGPNNSYPSSRGKSVKCLTPRFLGLILPCVSAQFEEPRINNLNPSLYGNELRS